jgi:hypothetical protein
LAARLLRLCAHRLEASAKSGEIAQRAQEAVHVVKTSEGSSCIGTL